MTKKKKKCICKCDYLFNCIFPPEFLHSVFWNRSGPGERIRFLINQSERFSVIVKLKYIIYT